MRNYSPPADLAEARPPCCSFQSRVLQVQFSSQVQCHSCPLYSPRAIFTVTSLFMILCFVLPDHMVICARCGCTYRGENVMREVRGTERRGDLGVGGAVPTVSLAHPFSVCWCSCFCHQHMYLGPPPLPGNSLRSH